MANDIKQIIDPRIEILFSINLVNEIKKRIWYTGTDLSNNHYRYFRE